MTAGVSDEDRRQCLEAGMTEHLPKPITQAQVQAILGRLPGRPATAAAPAGPPEPAPWTLPAFDIPAVQQRMGVDPSRLAAVLWRFARDFAGTPDELEQVLAAGDLDGAARIAHRVKGTAGTVGAVVLQRAAASFEQELRAGALSASFPAFLQALRDAIDTVTTRVPAPGADRPAPEFDGVALSAALDRLSRILEEHDLVPDSLLDEVCGRLAAPATERLAESLRNEVESFDYARARQTVEAIARALDANRNAHV
jgi:HPt (histidine-containing phosphotransfer) domain-containing protein